MTERAANQFLTALIVFKEKIKEFKEDGRDSDFIEWLMANMTGGVPWSDFEVSDRQAAENALFSHDNPDNMAKQYGRYIEQQYRGREPWYKNLFR